MPKQPTPPHIVLEIRDMRKSGYSLRDIKKIFPLSNSTLHKYTCDIIFKQSSESKELIRRKACSAIVRKNALKGASARNAAERKLESMNLKELFYLGLGIYIGEGTKTNSQVRITNADPSVLMLSKIWLQRCLHIPIENIRIGLHIYPDNLPVKAVEYWSTLLNIPSTQFYKCTIDLRIKPKTGRNNRVLQYGTAQMYVVANGNKNFGSQLHRDIIGYIDRSKYLAGMVQW